MVAGRDQLRPPRGLDHFAIAWRLAAAGWLGCAALQFILYLRPSPYGGPFMLQWRTFIIRPLVYDLMAVWLIALPFMILWLVFSRRELPSRRWRFLHIILAGLLGLNLVLAALDHELYRFLGIRLGPSFLNTFGHPTMLGDSLVLNYLRADRGGSYVALIIATGVPALFFVSAMFLIRRSPRLAEETRFGRNVAAAILLLPLATGVIGYGLAKAKFRLMRMEPVTFAMIRDAAQSYDDDAAPANIAGLTRRWQAEWQAGTTDRGWHFPDRERPFLRVPIDPAAPAPESRWNIIMLQLETMRGLETGHLRPELKPSPTPYLDSLARTGSAAVYTRALSMGPPSINGMFSSHCSIVPSSRRFITSLTHVSFYCLPDALRRQGYRAEMFTVGDTDMENSTRWIRTAFDKLWRHPELGQVDRSNFRLAADRIREMGRSGPFLATIMSASNHHPFHSPEPALDINRNDTVHQRIRNSVHYTDDVVREFIESLRDEPWFDRTLFVIYGDHGYNLGEHDGVVGGYTLYRESVWVPLLIVGAHPRLPKGRHDGLVTLLDVAPTLADLIDLREENPWQGHSLLRLRGQREVRFGFRDSLLAEKGEWSAVRDPHDGSSKLYRSSDWLQRKNEVNAFPEVARSLLEEADTARRFNDYLLRHDRIWPTKPL